MKAASSSKTEFEKRAINKDVFLYIINRVNAAITLCSNCLRCNAEKKKSDNSKSYNRRYYNIYIELTA